MHIKRTAQAEYSFVRRNCVLVRGVASIVYGDMCMCCCGCCCSCVFHTNTHTHEHEHSMVVGSCSFICAWRVYVPPYGLERRGSCAHRRGEANNCARSGLALVLRVANSTHISSISSSSAQSTHIGPNASVCVWMCVYVGCDYARSRNIIRGRAYAHVQLELCICESICTTTTTAARTVTVLCGCCCGGDGGGGGG